MGYSLWLGRLVYGLRGQRKQFRFEILYFAVMVVLAVIVLGLGFSLPYIDHAYFYYFYSYATRPSGSRSCSSRWSPIRI